MRARFHSLAAAVAASILLAGCQTATRSVTPEPASAALSAQMHPTIRAEFDKDYIHIIVKGTSAEAMARACRGLVRVRADYLDSLRLVLRTNDIEFGAGSSRKEVAKKVAEHRKERDCEALSDGLNGRGYDNIFLEKAL
jgi:hypothetical protein